MSLNDGLIAPDFEFENEIGEKIKFSGFFGKWLVLYFYPKDNTSGCTAEACDFRDNMQSLSDINTVVMGVSPDNAKSHSNFIEKYNLNFTLISDSDKSICNLYDIIGEKSMYGKKYLGVIRTTYLINPDGLIAYVFNNVKVKGHIEEVKNKITELQAKQ